MKWFRKCPCVKSMRVNSMRWVNPIVENRDAPHTLAQPDEWALKSCPQCSGSGVIIEEGVTQRDLELLQSDFRKRLARPI